MPRVVALVALVAALAAPIPGRAEAPATAPDEPVGVTLDWGDLQPASAPASQPATIPAITEFQTAPEPPPPRPATPDLHTRPRGFGIGVYGLGYFPVGSWIDHPYAGTIAPKGLDYFGPGGGGALELLIRHRRVNFFLRGEGGALSSTAWEHWAADHGGSVTVRTQVWGVHVGGGVVLAYLGRSRIESDVLIGALGLRGRETDHRYDLTYPLGFLKPTASLRWRLAAAFAVLRGLELYTAFEAGFTAEDMAAVPGKGPAVLLTLQLGVRLWPALMRGAR